MDEFRHLTPLTSKLRTLLDSSKMKYGQVYLFTKQCSLNLLVHIPVEHNATIIRLLNDVAGLKY